MVVSPSTGGIRSFAGEVALEMRSLGVLVKHVEVAEAGGALRSAVRAWRSEIGLRARPAMVHVELGRGSRGAFWFGLLAVLLRCPLSTTAHDPPTVIKNPAAGIVAMRSRLGTAVGHRVLSPLLDGLLVALYRRSSRSTSCLSSDAARALRVQGWRAVRTTRHPARLPELPGPPPSRCAYVLLAGHLGPGKGLEVLGAAWRSVKPVELKVVGNAAENDRRWVDRQLQGAFGAPPEWVQNASDVEFDDYVRHAAVVVLPYSVSNPASGVLLKAMAFGRAVVMTDVAAAADIRPEIDAVVVPSDDPAALAEGVNSLLDSPQTRDRLGAAAAAAASSRSWSNHVVGLLDAWESRGLLPQERARA